MPELPEVETIRRDLVKRLVGRTIDSVRLSREDILRRTCRPELIRALTGAQVMSVDRRGKNLIVEISGDAALLVNLGMTGQLFICGAEVELEKHSHFRAHLSDGNRLIFRDVRRFGHLELSDVHGVHDSYTLRNVGVDAIGEEFTPRYLAEMLQGRTALLKSALLDQSRLAGLGNIYVCEVLFRAGIDPEATCSDVAADETGRLHRAIREVLREAIAAEGTTISDYVTGNGVPGSFQERLEVYGREGEPCRRGECEHEIVRIVQSNRATFFCPGCQRGGGDQLE